MTVQTQRQIFHLLLPLSYTLYIPTLQHMESSSWRKTWHLFHSYYCHTGSFVGSKELSPRTKSRSACVVASSIIIASPRQKLLGFLVRQAVAQSKTFLHRDDAIVKCNAIALIRLSVWGSGTRYPPRGLSFQLTEEIFIGRRGYLVGRSTICQMVNASEG